MRELARLGALVTKEFRQILRNRPLVIILIVPPTLILLLFGVTLKPVTDNIPLAVVDQSKTPESRQLIDALSSSRAFATPIYYSDIRSLSSALERGYVSTGLIVPPTFRSDLQSGQANTQILIDGVNSYVAGFAASYSGQIVNAQSAMLAGNPPPPFDLGVSYIYNPGLVSAWFFVPGLLGSLLMNMSTISSAVNAVQEKDRGTLEQLLMTPAAAWQIIAAKMVPLWVLFQIVLTTALIVANLVFAVPMHGNLVLLYAIASIYILGGLSLGLMIATVVGNRVQVILTALFINLPLMMLSGALAPIESMPQIVQTISLANPLRHFAWIMRELLVKGAGLDLLLPSICYLAFFTAVMLTIASLRYRSQLG